MGNKLFGKYKIYDCEHFGDIESAQHDLQRHNVEIIDIYWDRRDCGEAYIEFCFAEKDFKQVYRALHSCAVFEDNIWDYVQPDQSWAEGVKFPIVDERDFAKTQHKHHEDIAEGFEQRLPLYITFDAKGIDNPKAIIEDFLKILPHPRKINRVAATLLDYFDRPHYGFLITSDLTNLNEELWNASRRFFDERQLDGYSKIDHRYNHRYHHDFRWKVEQRVQELKEQQRQSAPAEQPQRRRMRR